MLSLCLVLMLSAASVLSESVRETETWMPMKTSEAVGMSTRGGDLEASGHSPTGSDFGFTDDGDDDYLYDDDEDYEEFSGSGDRETSMPTEPTTSVKPDINDNKIPEPERPVRPTVNEVEIVKNSNQIPHLRNENPGDDQLSNVLMSHTGEDSILSKTEFLAALIAALAVGLMFAVLLILFLIYRMKKKDEGSYDLSKKPIYKKAPTTEIYA
ncbi:syndecan-4 isoform X2 [Archocentrus centrarchus]|uniref:syndecan-4 isoform X2 n=1 Tax=Archocentrus centrarchus TaxID=63155 RepID=UPI0011E9DD28|nr:syndecan-4-like isoform X2 [Archocentrus centrarchus]